MIWIFNLERASAGLCDNYDDVIQYITELENFKLPANRMKSSHPCDMSDLVSDTMHDKKQWCIQFCKDHNYVIVETPSQPSDLSPAQRNLPRQSLYPENRLERAN